jgi:c-di-AMP phosphodiesterase-like protein
MVKKMTNSFKEKILKIVSIAILLIFISILYMKWVKEITGFHLKFFLIACILSAGLTAVLV